MANLNYKNAVFDLIISNSTLHHVSLEKSLKEMYRVLMPGGIIWFSEPNMMNPQVFIERKFRFIGKMLQVTKGETAFFSWRIKKTLEEIGFKRVQIKYFDFLHPLTPQPLINLVVWVSEKLERLPLLNGLSGSLLITAVK